MPNAPASAGASRVRNRKSRRAAVDWMAAWVLGNERPDLYSGAPEGLRETSFFDLLLKLAGPCKRRSKDPSLKRPGSPVAPE